MKIKKILFVILGLIFFILGAIGAALPVLPTTPFLLAAAACFARGSEKFNVWFTNTKLYRSHLHSFVNDRSMTLPTKIKICSFATIMLLIAFFLVSNIYAKAIIICVILFKYYYFIFKIKTITPKQSQSNDYQMR